MIASALPASLAFNDIQLDIIDRNGKPWLTAGDLARALGYSRADKVSQIFSRNADEFADDMSQNLNLRVRDSDGVQRPRDTRIFSTRGCHLIAMLAKTPVAKQFRRWVLDVLDGLSVPEPSNIDHTAILRAAIHGRASSFPEPERRSVISRLWHEVHKEFDVFRVSDIPAEKAAEVCGFVASVALEGDYLPKPEAPKKEGEVTLTKQDCHDTFHVLHHLGCLEQDVPNLISLRQTTESPWMGRAIEHLRISMMMAKNLRARNPEIRDAYQATIRKIS